MKVVKRRLGRRIAPTGQLGLGVVATVLAFAAYLVVSAASASGSPPLKTVQFGHASYQAAEAHTNVPIDITRTVAKGPASVTFSTTSAGTAVAGTDFTPVSGVVVRFASGESVKQVSVEIFDDHSGGPDKTVGLSLSAPKGATLGTPSTPLLTIVEPPTLAVTVPAGTTFQPPGTLGVVENYVFTGDVLDYTYGPVTVTATDGHGATMTDFGGVVSLSSADCPLVVNGGTSYTFTSSDQGTHTFGVAFGDSSAFGTPGLSGQLTARSCTVTAHEQTGTYLDASAGVSVWPGEYCDGLDNNGNGLVDELYPQKGSTVTVLNGGVLQTGTWICGLDRVSIVPSVP